MRSMSPSASQHENSATKSSPPRNRNDAQREPSSHSSLNDARDTPAMRQYKRFKAMHPECILFFRMGDFYEMFYDDAVTAHKALGITLTQRSAGVPMAGVPYHAVESYLRRMIEQGYRVAVCDQIQDPKDAKGVVDRAVTRVVTPGTLVDENLLDAGAANVVAAVMFTEAGDNSPAVIAAAELSTGSFTILHATGETVLDELARLSPSEVLYVETADGEAPKRITAIRNILNCALTARPAWTFRTRDAGDLLREHFAVKTLAGFGLDDDEPLIAPAGALLRYLLETQTGGDENSTQPAQGNALSHLRPPTKPAQVESVMLDAASLRSLEIERTMRTGSTDGSLLSVFKHCVTPMGRRLLREWLCYPSRNLNTITQRQDAVAALLEDRELAIDVTEHLSRVQDVARITGRIAMNRATPRDVVALARSLTQITKLIELLDAGDAFRSRVEELATLSDVLAPLARTIAQKCVDDAPAHMREGGLFRDGIDSELDEARLLQRDANTWLAAFQKKLIDTTGIASLKVGYNKVFGYYIEITHAHAGKKIPDDFNRKQTLKNAERYTTVELKEFEEKVTTAEARAVEREKVLFEKLCAQCAQQIAPIGRYAEIVAEIDVLGCFAEVAARNGYIRPRVVEKPALHIAQGRHPVLDATLKQQFVPNDCALGRHEGTEARRHEEKNAASLALITGPNMAGKSTYIRQVALITLLAHTGSFVPAQSAVIGLTDRIFTRIGASDELHAGQSTFMVEMTETANILHHATDRSLIILDEIGRGTSTLDGLSLAWAIAEALAEVKCRTLFATHYHELTNLAEQLPQVTNLHVAVREWNDEVVFLYRIQSGRADRSYGIHVAKIAGLPPKAIERAKNLLESLSVQHESGTREQAKKNTKPQPQMSLFTEYLEHPAMDELRSLNIEAMSPMDAFDALRTLKKKIEE